MAEYRRAFPRLPPGTIKEKEKIMGKINEAAEREARIAALPESERAEIRAIQERAAKALAGQQDKTRYGKGLKEPRPDVTDTGSRIGDPEYAAKRRADGIDGAYERGTVKIKIRGADGKMPRKATEVPATLANLRVALEQARKGAPKKPESIKAKAELCASLLRRIRAAEAGTEALAAPKAGAAIGQRDHGMIDGIALVKGRDMTNVKPVGRGKNDQPRNGTMAGNLGAERNDRIAVHGPVDRSKHDPGTGDACTVKECKRTHVKGQLHGTKLCADSMCDHVAGGRFAPEGDRARTYRQLNVELSRAGRARYFKVVASNRRKAGRAAERGRKVNPVTERPYSEPHRYGELAGAARVTGERGDVTRASEAEMIMRMRPHA